MNLHPIITPNAKGQLVIPISLRKQLQLTPTTPMEIQAVGQHLVLKPIKAIVTADSDKHQYLDALRQTADSWAGVPLTTKHDLEIKASKRRRQTWSS